MTSPTLIAQSPLWRRIRWLVWGGAGGLLLLPLVAMQFTDEVNWDAFDFLVMGGMLGLVAGAFELALRVARSHAYVVACGIAVGTAFLMSWANLAVGIIGNEDNPANLLFFGVMALGFGVAALRGFRSAGMAQAMGLTALAQAAVALIAWWLDGVYILVLTAVFVALWLTARHLFLLAGRQEAAGA